MVNTYKMFLWFLAHTNTTAKPLRLPAGFNNKYNFGLTTTQQQAHKELLQDLQTTIVIYGSHQHNSEQWLSKFLQDFQTSTLMVAQPHNSGRWLSKSLQDLYNNNNDLSDHKQLQQTSLGHKYQIIYQTSTIEHLGLYRPWCLSKIQ